MKLSSRAANPVGAAFVLCSANRDTAPDIARSLRPYLRALPEGLVAYDDNQGIECPVTEWDEYLRIIAEGTDDLRQAEFAAEAVAAGCVVAHEILNVQVVKPHIQEKLHRGLAAVAFLPHDIT